jgi:hypothetical protein
LQATFKAQIVSAKENMKQLILVFLFSAVFFGGKAASSDTAFVDYETFRRLSKREIKERFGTDDAARGIIVITTGARRRVGGGVYRRW